MTTVDQDGLEWFRMDQDRLEGLKWTRVRRFEGMDQSRLGWTKWTRMDQSRL